MVDKSQEKTIYLVRHGQSVANVGSIFDAQDTPINEEGLLQANHLAKRIKEVVFEKLLASPLPRARDTAQAITRETGIGAEYLEELAEARNPSSIEGKPYEDLEASAMWHAWQASLWNEGPKVENGEDYSEIIARADYLLRSFFARAEKSIVAVSHGFLIRTIIARVALGDALTAPAFKNFQLRSSSENTGISVIKYKKSYKGTGWHLWTFNDHAHLE